MRNPASPFPPPARWLAVAALALTVWLASGRVVGSRASDRYHTPHCASAGAILTHNLREWPTARAARADGYRPCGHCFRDD